MDGTTATRQNARGLVVTETFNPANARSTSVRETCLTCSTSSLVNGAANRFLPSGESVKASSVYQKPAVGTAEQAAIAATNTRAPTISPRTAAAILLREQWPSLGIANGPASSHGPSRTGC